VAFSRKTGGFTKYWRLYKNQADFEKYWHFSEKQADFQNWRHAEKQADDRILAGVKIPVPGEKPAGLENTGGPFTF
jgi:hypothetical protein